MSTNFYARKLCGSCGETREIHIGKRNTGWCFSLHVEPGPGCPSNLKEWRDLLGSDGWVIADEYGVPYTPEEMVTEITVHEPVAREDQFHSKGAGRDPSTGLLRHPVDGFCIGQGAGPWDMLTGEFC